MEDEAVHDDSLFWDRMFGGEKSRFGLLVYSTIALEKASDIAEGVDILSLPSEVVVIGVRKCGRE